MKNLSKFFYLTVIMVMLAGLVFQVTPARASTLAEIETSIDDGLAYLAGIQNVDGSWSGDFTVGITCTAVSKFQDRAYEKGYTSPFDPAYTYSDEITLAYQYIFANAHKQTPLAVQTAGDPDTNANGYGVWFGSPASAPTYSEVNYETALCLMAMASSKLPDHPNEGALDFDGVGGVDTFGQLSQEGVDFLAWAQNDTGANRGGWRYGFNPQDSDGSVAGFATLGLAYAESFGATVPAFVKTELNNWITYDQCADGGAGYTACPGSNLYRTGHLITMMAFVGDTPATPRMDNALKYIESNWGLPLPDGTGFLGTWSLMKGLSYSGVHLLDLDGDTVRDDDWFNADPTTGDDLATYTIGLQQVDGGWGAGSFYEGNSAALKAAFALLVLEKASPPPPNTPPVANNDIYWTAMATLLNGTTVLANDTDGDSDPLTAALVAGPTHAAAFNFNANGTFTYTPANGFSGPDTFTYKANDGSANSNTATVTINVENHAPTSLELSNRFIQEERPAGVIIGALTSTDTDLTDAVTYSLTDTVACAGTDNGYFAVNGTNLVTSGTPRIDFQTKYYLSICLRVTDLGGLTFDQPVTIVVRSIHQFPMDTNGDGKDDYVTFRPNAGTWHLRLAPPIIPFGQLWDLPVAADYNGDGKDDIAVFRPAAIGTWHIRNQGAPINFGTAGDVPLPLDYNGDGKDDIAVFRPSTATWHIRFQVLSLAFGQVGDIPVPADYNGDGKADLAVFTPATGTWTIRNQAPIVFGQDGDIPVPADYNNDGKADIAVYRPSTGTWHIRNQGVVTFGGFYDVPFPMYLQSATTLNYVVIHTGAAAIEWQAQGLPTINFGALEDVHQ